MGRAVAMEALVSLFGGYFASGLLYIASVI